MNFSSSLIYSNISKLMLPKWFQYGGNAQPRRRSQYVAQRVYDKGYVQPSCLMVRA